MAYIDIEIWDGTGNKKNTVQVPDDVPINKLIVVLLERLSYPKYDPTGGQLLSYKLHHRPTGKQLKAMPNFAQCVVLELGKCGFKILIVLRYKHVCYR